MSFRRRSAILLSSVVLAGAAAACTNADTDDGGGTSGRGSGGDGNGNDAGSAGKAGGDNSASGTATQAGAGGDSGRELPGSAGPDDIRVNEFHHPVGPDIEHGQEVYRFETFGNEGFWTRALQPPQGMEASGLTIAGALELGLNFDIDAVPTDLQAQLADEAKSDLSKKQAPLMNDPLAFLALLEANAVVGLPARGVKKLNGKLDINATNVFAGESVGMSCALCHSITDGSVYALPHGGGIGKRLDGLPNHDLNFGATIALGEGTRAYYPTLALDLVANDHKSVSRKGPGVELISKAGTEKEVDKFLNDPELYPVGMFDDANDGNAAPMKNAPIFRTDLGAPWGTDGSIEQLQNFNNLVYTAILACASTTVRSST